MNFRLLIAGVAVSAAINISFGSATSINVFQRCVDIPTASIGSTFNISCLTGQRIIVDSALIGATSGYMPPTDCSITDKTCTRNVSFVAENCTGYSSCEIAPRLLLHDDESGFSCVVSNFKLLGANFVSINYFCITPRAEFYGDISRFEADIFTNDSVPVYISSYPNFPDGIQSTVPFRCSCSFTPKPQPISLTGWIIIRTVLVKLSGIDPNSEVLSIRFGNETRLNFNSPSTTVNNITYIPINSAFTITYERRSYVAAATSKFLLELTVGSSPGPGTAGHIKCNASSLNDSFDFSSTFSSTMKIDLTIADSSPWNQKSESQGQVLTPGAAVGIAFGVVGFIIIVVVAIVILLIRRQRGKKTNSQEKQNQTSGELDLNKRIHESQHDESSHQPSSINQSHEDPNVFTTQPAHMCEDQQFSTEGDSVDDDIIRSKHSDISYRDSDVEVPNNQYEPLRRDATARNTYDNPTPEEKQYQSLV